MTLKTIWQWISSNQWSLTTTTKNIAIKFYENEHLESVKFLIYSDLLLMINQISKEILNLNICQQLIIIDCEETILTLPILLGILQSNNSFFICDFNWPEAILKESLMFLKPSLLIHQRQNKKVIVNQTMNSTLSTSIVLLEQQVDFYKMTNDCSYKDIAYVVSSSGSTGIPKLIFVSHECILPNLEQLKLIFDVTSIDCLFRSTPLTFDPSFIDIFLAMHCGASLCIFSNKIRENSLLIASVFRQSQCTIAQMTPSFFRQIETICDFLQLKSLILGGEPFPSLSNSTIQQLIQHNKRLINIYGLTEMSCWASYYILTKNDLKRTNEIPLGQPLNETLVNLQSFSNENISGFQIILESSTRWTQINDRLSEKKFRFLTDDIVRYDQETNEIFYIGRKTLTFKRFGIMINLEYIEQIAYQSNLIDQCACLMLTEEENYLILFCKFKINDKIDQLLIFLKSKLTEHFLPNRIVSLQTNIPLNVNGKIDRHKLYSIYEKHPSDRNIKNIWQNLINQIPEMNSNFIAQGGNSLLTLTLIEQIKQSYSSVSTDDLFDLILHKTFQDLISYLINPFQQRATTTNELFSSNLKFKSIFDSNENFIWSIERCSKFYLHTNNQITQYSSLPNNQSISPKNFILNWKCSMNKCIDASPVIVLIDDIRQYVIIASHAGLINAYQIDTGELQWSFQANDRIEASGTISRNGEFFLIGDYSGILYIINCLNGEFYSSYQCTDLIKTTPCIHKQFDVIYLGAHDQYLHAIQLQKNSCQCIWKIRLNSSCVSSPQISEDNTRIYVATLSGNILAIQSNDGTIIWKKSFHKPIFSTMLIWKEKFLIIGCVDQNIYCLNTIDGQQKWIFQTNGPIFSSPCLFNNNLLIGCHDQYLYSLDLSHEEQAKLKWKCLFPSMIYASPFVLVHDEIVLVGSTNGCLRLLNISTGEIISQIELNDKGLFSSPISYKNLIFIGSRDDFFYCYKLIC